MTFSGMLGLGTTVGGQALALETALLMEMNLVRCFIKGDLENIFGTAKR